MVKHTSGPSRGGTLFFGSNLADSDYVPVEIVFSATDSTLCQTFRRDLGYVSSGVGVFPGIVYDMSNPGSPRRLNVCFVEDAAQGAADLQWNPNGNSVGKREYLFVMDSDYDNTGLTYAGTNILSDGAILDVQYAWWPQVMPGETLLGDLPASLLINPYYVKNFRGIPDSTQITLTWTFPDLSADYYRITYGVSGPAATVLDSASAPTVSYEHSGLVTGTDYSYFVTAIDAMGVELGRSKEITVTAQSVSSGLTLTGYWHERGTYGDIWGYTEPTTLIEYALICARNEGVSIIDIDADPPVEVAFIPSIAPDTDAKDVKIYENYAIIIKENEDAQVIDLTDIFNPVQIATIPMPGGGAHNCLVEGDYLYVIGDHNIGGLLIYDISSPASPSLVGDFQPFYYHDIDIYNDTVCATGIYGDGVDLIDVTNKSAPSLIGRFNYAGSGAHNAEFTPDGQYVFIGDEIGTNGNHIRTFDISDPLNVTLESELIVDPLAAVHNCYILEDTLLVVGHYTEGVRIWNVADPINPFEIAYYDTYLQSGYGYAGCWSVYPYFASGRIVASDMQTGLYVLEMEDKGTGGCCVGSSGNVNADAGDDVDISDLTALVNHLFVTFQPLTCPAEANINGDAGGDVDISDLTSLVNHLFVTFAPVAPCL